MSNDFYVYTFAYDVSGIKSLVLSYRLDNDGKNPLDDVANEVFDPPALGLDCCGPWINVTMTKRPFPAGNESGVVFSVTPTAIADEYYYQRTTTTTTTMVRCSAP